MKRCLCGLIPGGACRFLLGWTKKTSKRERPGFLVDQHDDQKDASKYHF